MIGILHPDMEKYRHLLDAQHELSKIYNAERTKYKINKGKEEKKRFKEKRKQQKINI
jgi:hypothetical protein